MADVWSARVSTPRVAERRRIRTFVLHDRRGGFDRRRRAAILGALRDSPELLVSVLVALNALSVIDGFYTLVEVGAGVAREANPLLAAAGARSPLLAIVLKAASMAFVTTVVWRNRRRRAVLAVGVGAVAAYIAVVLYHRYSLTAIGLL